MSAQVVRAAVRWAGPGRRLTREAAIQVAVGAGFREVLVSSGWVPLAEWHPYGVGSWNDPGPTFGYVCSVDVFGQAIRDEVRERDQSKAEASSWPLGVWRLR